MGISRRNFLKILTAAGACDRHGKGFGPCLAVEGPIRPVRLPRGPDPLHRLSQVRTSMR
jgi:hypothetical protein